VNFKKAKTAQEALEVLGLSAKDHPTIHEVKKAYKQQAFKYHPDKNKDDEQALRKFMEISYAYEMLTNPHFRLQEEKDGGSELNVSTSVMLRFEECFFGKRLRLSTSVSEVDYHKDTADKKDSYFQVDHKIDPLIIDVPPGTLSRNFLFCGKGLRSASGACGDLTIVVSAKEHALFKMDGTGNVLIEVGVPLRTMLKGGSLDVPTMYGVKPVRVPPGTPPGTQLKMPRLGPNKRGYQIVTVKAEFPTPDELRTHQDWKEVCIDWDAVVPEEDVELENLLSAFKAAKP
jgi:DnaJ-class molecular chaperone